ncbi:TolC family protein [Ferruginibacter paludis]|uniref:TolC family protein n=1 Tax=Ferruginibacter paludis TaxID=1310417 RepID=UPI0025B4B64F|nr:TolC family protein [Ferruginibacter paludis]MDN3658029.1 TolC family protein [Ferruginibacter paludis]
MKQTVVSIFLFFSMLCVKAQNILRLPDAVNIALKNSLDIQLNKNLVEANTVLNNYGVAGGLPLVTGSLTDNEQIASINQKLNTGVSIQRDAAATNNFALGVTGSILLYNGNRVIATKARLATLVKQSEQQLNAQVQNILADVMVGYYDIVRQQSYMKTIEKSIDASNQQLQIVQARQSVGLANNADLFQAQIDLNALVQAQQSQQLIIDQAKTELLRQLTVNSDSSIAIQDTIIVDRNIQLDNVLNKLNKNADIIAAQDQVQINELLVKETAALRYPSIRATTGYNFSRNKAAAGQILLNQNYGPSVGVSIGIPIYNGSIYKRQQKVAEINVNNAVLDKQILMRDYSAQVVKSFQSYTSTLKQLETEQQNYNLSNQLLELALQRFQFKQATIVDVKNAQQSFEASGYRLVNLNYAAKTAEIELKRLANELNLQIQ